LTDSDLQKIIKIRGEPHTVIDALIRAVTHISYHVGQIVQLSRHLAKDQWTVITVPRGGSKQFGAATRKKYESK
jgi:hypothetical protein